MDTVLLGAEPELSVTVEDGLLVLEMEVVVVPRGETELDDENDEDEEMPVLLRADCLIPKTDELEPDVGFPTSPLR